MTNNKMTEEQVVVVQGLLDKQVVRMMKASDDSNKANKSSLAEESFKDYCFSLYCQESQKLEGMKEMAKALFPEVEFVETGCCMNHDFKVIMKVG